jgi:hypothetical protein
MAPHALLSGATISSHHRKRNPSATSTGPFLIRWKSLRLRRILDVGAMFGWIRLTGGWILYQRIGWLSDRINWHDGPRQVRHGLVNRK